MRVERYRAFGGQKVPVAGFVGVIKALLQLVAQVQGALVVRSWQPSRFGFVLFDGLREGGNFSGELDDAVDFSGLLNHDG